MAGQSRLSATAEQVAGLHHLAHRTFQDAADLDDAIHAAVADLNRERSRPRPCDKPRSTA